MFILPEERKQILWKRHRCWSHLCSDQPPKPSGWFTTFSKKFTNLSPTPTKTKLKQHQSTHLRSTCKCQLLAPAMSCTKSSSCFSWIDCFSGTSRNFQTKLEVHIIESYGLHWSVFLKIICVELYKMNSEMMKIEKLGSWSLHQTIKTTVERKTCSEFEYLPNHCFRSLDCKVPGDCFESFQTCHT